MGITDRLRRSLNGQEEEDEDGILTSISTSSTLSWSTRIRGFIACFVFGIVLSILGTVFVFFQNYIAFAVLYSLGTITSLVSTMFLMGPLKQLKKMFDPTRLIATIVLLVCVAMTIVAAVALKIAGLCILFCILQFIALAWYSISYIPFASDYCILILNALSNAYHKSFAVFTICLTLAVYVFNSVSILYAPVLSSLMQLLALSFTGELDTGVSNCHFS